MPQLDVSDILDDPDFNEQIIVKRNAQTIDDHGRAVIQKVDIKCFAVVTIGAPDALQRAADFEAGKDTITVHTRQKLTGPSSAPPPGQDYQPDVICWAGAQYVVRKLYDWSHYGSGYTAAECEMLNVTEKSPE